MANSRFGLIDGLTDLDELIEETNKLQAENLRYLKSINSLQVQNQELLKQNQSLQNQIASTLENNNRLLNVLAKKDYTIDAPQLRDITLDLDPEYFMFLKDMLLPEYETLIYKFSSVNVSTKRLVLEKNFKGKLEEIYFRSDSSDADNSDYSVLIEADNEPIYDDSYTNWEADSDYMTDMTAFDDGTYYLLQFNNIFFNKKIKVEIYNAGTPTFETVYMKLFRMRNE